MGYEVYIDVVHHHKHEQGDGEKLDWCVRYAEPDGEASQRTPDQMRAVVAALRDMAAEYDPDVVCTHCGEPRHAHHGYPKELPRCFNRLGPTTQYKWWQNPLDPHREKLTRALERIADVNLLRLPLTERSDTLTGVVAIARAALDPKPESPTDGDD